VDGRWKEIDVRTWERRATYEGFRLSSFPFLVIGLDIALGDSVEFWRENAISPYIACIYVACRAANDIAAFRQRIRGDKLVEHERVHADYTVPSGAESFTVRQVEFDVDFVRFQQRARAPESGKFVSPADPAESDHWVFLSCLPWLSFSHVVQPMKSRDDSVPRLAWGKFSLRNGAWQMPISIQAHHAIVDGFHVARLVEQMVAYFRDPAATFAASTLATRGSGEE